MGIFGWSYPPGCSGPPWDEDYPCEVCGEFPDDCICPECPVCNTHGDPACYIDHGLRRTEGQKFNLEVHERNWEEDAKSWDDYGDEYQSHLDVSIFDEEEENK